MDNSPLSTHPAVDHRFTLLACTICADQQIHSQELKVLNSLAQQLDASEETLQALQQVLEENAQVSLAEAANAIPTQQRREAFRQVIAIASIGVDLFDMHLEREHERKMADIRRDITSQFKAIAADLEQQMQTQLQQFEGQVYGQIEDYIADARQQTEAAIAASRSELGQLVTIRHTLQSVLGAIAALNAQPCRSEDEAADERSHQRRAKSSSR